MKNSRPLLIHKRSKFGSGCNYCIGFYLISIYFFAVSIMQDYYIKKRKHFVIISQDNSVIQSKSCQ